MAEQIAPRIGGIQRCYEKALRKNGSLQGRVVLRFVIQPDGALTDVVVEKDTMGEASVSACMLGVASRWRFDLQGDGKTPISFPFVFSNQDALQDERPDLGTALLQREHQLWNCFVSEAAAHPGLDSHMTVDFSIDQLGLLTQVAVHENGTGSAAVAECVQRELTGLPSVRGQRPGRRLRLHMRYQHGDPGASRLRLDSL